MIEMSICRAHQIFIISCFSIKPLSAIEKMQLLQDLEKKDMFFIFLMILFFLIQWMFHGLLISKGNLVVYAYSSLCAFNRPIHL